MPISNPKLYAVVSKTDPASQRPKKRNIAEIRESKRSEFRVKAKIDQACKLLDALEQRTDMLAGTIQVLQRRKAKALARYARIEAGIIAEMDRAGLNKADGWNRLCSTRPATASVDIVDEALIPEHLCKTELVTKPLKALIKAELSRGVDVPGVRLLQTTSLLRTQATK